MPSYMRLDGTKTNAEAKEMKGDHPGPECLCDSCLKVEKLQKLVVVDVEDQGVLAFQDPETGRYYYPIEGFTVTGDDLSDRFKEIEEE